MATVMKMRRQIFFCVTLNERHADNPFHDRHYENVVSDAFRRTEVKTYVENVEVVMMVDGVPYAE